MRINNAIAFLMCMVAASACSGSIPKPCDPEVAGTRMELLATACRVEAEKKCPGYADMTETEKLSCPGVAECWSKIEKIEMECRDN